MGRSGRKRQAFLYHPRHSRESGNPARRVNAGRASQTSVIPAKAGIQREEWTLTFWEIGRKRCVVHSLWIPAFAGMTEVVGAEVEVDSLLWIPAFAGMTCGVGGIRGGERHAFIHRLYPVIPAKAGIQGEG